MRITSLYLRHFRNYRECQVDFAPGFNCFYGHNAQGKTNLLEAIYLVITGRSFRTRHLKDLIQEGCEAFFLQVVFQKHQIAQKLSFAFNGVERRILYNDTPLPSVSSLLGIVQGVVSTPDDQEIIKGPPSIRRYFLDMQLAQVDPLYVHHLARYQRALKHRNLLLKQKSLSTMEVWEREMALSAAYITRQRLRTLQALEGASSEIHQRLTSGTGQLSLAYRCHVSHQASQEKMEETFRDLYAKHRPRELHLGATLVGPHKDDVAILLDGKEARVFGSEGQQHSCVAALRLAEWCRLSSRCDEEPLMLVDDLGTGLDGLRRSALQDYLGEMGQVLVSAQVPIAGKQADSASLFEVQEGCVLDPNPSGRCWGAPHRNASGTLLRRE